MKRPDPAPTPSVVPLAAPGSTPSHPELRAVLCWLNRRALASRFPKWRTVGPPEDDRSRQPLSIE